MALVKGQDFERDGEFRERTLQVNKGTFLRKFESQYRQFRFNAVGSRNQQSFWSREIPWHGLEIKRCYLEAG